MVGVVASRHKGTQRNGWLLVWPFNKQKEVHMLKRLISLAVALLIGLGPSLVVATDTIGSATKKGTVHGAVKRALGSSI